MGRTDHRYEDEWTAWHEGHLRGKVEADPGVITVQILPFSSGAHAASGIDSLAILQFPEAPGLGVVHLGGAREGVCLESQGILPFTPACSSSLGLSRRALPSPRACSEGIRPLSGYAVRRHTAYATVARVNTFQSPPSTGGCWSELHDLSVRIRVQSSSALDKVGDHMF